MAGTSCRPAVVSPVEKLACGATITLGSSPCSSSAKPRGRPTCGSSSTPKGPDGLPKVIDWQCEGQLTDSRGRVRAQKTLSGSGIDRLVGPWEFSRVIDSETLLAG